MFAISHCRRQYMYAVERAIFIDESFFTRNSHFAHDVHSTAHCICSVVVVVAQRRRNARHQHPKKSRFSNILTTTAITFCAAVIFLFHSNLSPFIHMMCFSTHLTPIHSLSLSRSPSPYLPLHMCRMVGNLVFNF